jgi:hypothetical protein
MYSSPLSELGGGGGGEDDDDDEDDEDEDDDDDEQESSAQIAEEVGVTFGSFGGGWSSLMAREVGVELT